MYTKTCPGPKRQDRRKDTGRGSQTDNSQTSDVLSGWARDSADSGVIRFAR